MTKIEKTIADIRENTPQELKEYDQWVCWKYKSTGKGKEPTKIPIDAKSGRAAKSNDPRTWCSFSIAIDALNQSGGQYAGVGFVLTADDPFVGLDYDHCIDEETGEVNQETIERLQLADTYTEVSPSGIGIRAIVKGALQRAIVKAGCEMYQQGRFLTITGDRYPGFGPDIRTLTDVEMIRLMPPDKRHGFKKPVAAPTELDKTKDKNWIIEPGERNNTLAQHAGLLRSRGFSKTDILDGIRALNTRRCKPPVDDEEVQRIVESICRYTPRVIETNISLRKVSDLESSGYILDNQGRIKPIRANVETWMRNNNRLMAKHNEYTDKIELDNGREIQDEDVTRCAVDMELAIGQGVPPVFVHEAVQRIAVQNKYHPIRDYLLSLKHDGKKRIEKIAARIFHDDAEEAAEAMRIMILQAVGRILEPGCMAQYIAVLIGRQGIGKTTFISTIFGGDNVTSFRGAVVDNSGHRLEGFWVFELAELSTLRKTDIEAFKDFVTLRSDHYRKPYSRTFTTRQRQSIFVATSNERTPFFDHTGNRRFLPVFCDDFINLDLTAKWRDQLLAEAVKRWREGERPIIREEIQEKITQRQEDCYCEDEWENLISEWIADGPGGGKREKFTTWDVSNEVLRITTDKLGRREQMRISTVLRRLGYEKRRARNNNGSLVYYWFSSPPF